MPEVPPVLRFREHFVYRIWGGRRLERMFGKCLPPEVPTGEAWLISDHASHESVVVDGPLAGSTLRELLDSVPGQVLGTGAKLTPHGRFPLLLKLLDANDDLSVQVHPDNETAARLGEPDVGKTEMWHVLHAEPGSRLVTGIRVGTPVEFVSAAKAGTLETLLEHVNVSAGASVFVPAGTVHAIGKGIVLAEIQQNSDITYRIYDYGRIEKNGRPRELHLRKAEAAIHWDRKPSGIVEPLACPQAGVRREILAACRYFAAEVVGVEGAYARNTRGYSFHIILATAGALVVTAGAGRAALAAGEAAMVLGAVPAFEVTGKGTFLEYYVPELAIDIARPLLEAGHSREAIARLGGTAVGNELAASLGLVNH